jgi:hypothetical protein
MVCARRTKSAFLAAHRIFALSSATRVFSPSIHPAEVTNLGMQRGVITCDCVRESLEMGRPAGRDQSVFGEVAA